MANEKTDRTLELLIKFLGMTGSSHDGEAIAAMRKAGEYARSLGGWEDLLRGRVKVIADPFASVAAPPPPGGPRVNSYTPPPPSTPRGPASPSPSYRQRAAQNGPGATSGGYGGTKPPRATQTNDYAGHCYACGILVGEHKGKRLRHRENPGKPERWVVLCSPCGGSTAPMPTRRAPKIKASTSDIFNAL